MTATNTWEPTAAGVLRLPSGLLVRGRGLRHPLPEGPRPDFALHLRGRRPDDVAWESRWIRWPDFWLPSDRAGFAEAVREAWERAGEARVEFACGGGRGRTGTALACLAIQDGVAPGEAVEYVRAHYSSHAVETPWQRRFVLGFRAAASRP
ncbi:protein-tyrosine phosphatase family protein [Streptomyces albiaxialis]|uniref:Protein-tyrosine phosphatase family protein n=1 Tax=Streptomyces albiaxialis TaxID=329523 RepID=A0ABP5HGB4_9ACTN